MAPLRKDARVEIIKKKTKTKWKMPPFEENLEGGREQGACGGQRGESIPFPHRERRRNIPGGKGG